MSAVTTLRIGPASLARLRTDAEAADSELLWLLDVAAEPAPDTLPALLEAGCLPAASLALDARGDPIEALVGRFATTEPAPLLEAVEERRVPLRHTSVTSLLVSRASVLELAPPDPGRFGGLAGDEWTGRLFARHAGWLVPASTVRVAAPRRGEPLATLRAARAAGWGRGETVRALYGSMRG